ncbi:phosphate ABC transporter substrate-binding protein PstS [Candidatus Mycobacterium methanotrophicum]|uniref:Phosphate-binding protein n=1 Tax=Candidatus Mycobacterium methanotrophicum TaxID=2943498 RepID=A0ABY4QP90_9MYCO|nr:phosphate ABC transporter substrate-binding protein PstS [Candidatus Mycobacterium methanotrophicum]UQX11613.1 phosphate ABC transporter substrate-binding protein PstS [Candidatus Mycobacterium methanotrophicum]
MKQRNGFRVANGLLMAGGLVFSACAQLDTPPKYAKGVKVDCGGKQDLTGSGSTAQANAMDHFITGYEETCSGKQLAYTASGSGAGVADFLAAKTDFGGSDSPLSGDEYAAAKRRCGGADAWNLPVVFGPIGITFNVKTTDVLTLDAPTLAKIFSGAITRWDDPAVTALNGSMPAEDIHVIYRSDASGTSDNFQQYLQAASGGVWTKGAGKTFNGGVGTSAQGNEGTSNAVKNTEGAITYNDWSYAMKHHVDVAGIKTAGGVVHIGNDWIGKTISDVTVKGKGNDLVLDLSKVYTTTTPGAYPILLASYEVVCSKYPEAEVGKAVKAFMQSTITEGQQGLTPLGYIPLPVDFQARVAAAVNNIS